VKVGDEDGLAVHVGGEDDRRGTSDPVLHVVGDLTEALDVRRGYLPGYDRGPVHPLGTLNEGADLFEALLEGLLSSKLARLARLFLQPADRFGELFDPDAQGSRDLLGFLGGADEVVKRLAAGEDLDAVEVGAVFSVGDDLERTDLGRTANVSAAAQLAREAVYLDDAHEVAILLAEEHHRPQVAGLFQRGRVVTDGLVFGDL
jgi:hypothetical protein